MSQLKVDSIIPRGGLPSGASGGIIQVVSFTKTDTFSEDVAQGAFSGDTGLNVTITPSSSSSKILILASVTMGCSNDNRNAITLFKGSSAIDAARGDTNSSNQRVSSSAFNTSTSHTSHITLNYLDSPNTTSSTTYGIRLSHGRNGNSANVFLNRASSESTGNDRMRAASFITAMEVSG
tara:strand:- start:198 stop:734 length:537 start_codon:yes stop_codon:yes gene_type:complete